MKKRTHDTERKAARQAGHAGLTPTRRPKNHATNPAAEHRRADGEAASDAGRTLTGSSKRHSGFTPRNRPATRKGWQ